MDARKALSTITRVNQRFGMGYVVEVLRGANNQRIRDMGHDKLPVTALARTEPRALGQRYPSAYSFRFGYATISPSTPLADRSGASGAAR
jgi:superfamily II DNA helicase RecQ